MHPESNPLMRELAKTRSAGPHPDADVLTGFAEGSLLSRERAQVLQHLLDCAECREIVNVSIDAEPEVVAGAVRPSAAPRDYRLWMPWAVGLAACLAVGITVMTVHRQRGRTDSGNQVRNVPSNLASNVPNNVARNEEPQIPPPVDKVQQSPPRVAAKKANSLSTAGMRKSSIPQETYKDESEAEVRPRSLQAAPAPQQPYATQNAGNAFGFAQAQAAQQTQAGQQAQASQQVQAVNQTVEVSPAFVAAAPTPPPVSAPGSFGSLAKEEKAHGALAAKPAVPAGQPYMAGALSTRAAVADAAARVHWRISPEGRVERQVGTGPWELELPAELAKMRVVSVYGGTVWVGGDEQRLYRSTDNGATWTAVVLPMKGTGAHSIDHVRFATSATGAVEAEDGTRWITTNGGTTWE